jgi:hypothetical protein
VEVSRAIDLPTTAEEAWAVLTAWERQADWMRDADRVEVLGQRREGVGVRVAVRTRLFQVPLFTEVLEVVAWEPPRRLGIAHGGPVRGTGEWRLDPMPGGVRFTWTERVALRLPIGRRIGAALGEAAAAVYRPVMRTLMGVAMRDLRAFLLATGPPRGAVAAGGPDG